ncbi:unnamed protein product [Fraxinus pennsylvanica]|uniref:Uncharacterized protein n=1 Tax=Fraxinus pennsylvanica TaxID=56036 RepID=A0AAD1ZJ73_9LAMI|nr:unnamed protein product [Fraxinus pennsylvanica]
MDTWRFLCSEEIEETLKRFQSSRISLSIFRYIESGREMASTSAPLVNGLGSTFLTGGNKSQALLSASVTVRVGGAVAPKRFVVVAAAPKKSWIPAVKSG